MKDFLFTLSLMTVGNKQRTAMYMLVISALVSRPTCIRRCSSVVAKNYRRCYQH